MSNNLIGNIGKIMGTIAAYSGGTDSYQSDPFLEKEFKVTYIDPKKLRRCHVCEESRTTLYKTGKNSKGEKIYICKDCKMLEALNENTGDELK